MAFPANHIYIYIYFVPVFSFQNRAVASAINACKNKREFYDDVAELAVKTANTSVMMRNLSSSLSWCHSSAASDLKLAAALDSLVYGSVLAVCDEWSSSSSSVVEAAATAATAVLPAATTEHHQLQVVI